MINIKKTWIEKISIISDVLKEILQDVKVQSLLQLAVDFDF